LRAAVEGRLVPTEAELARTEGRSYEPGDVLLERILQARRRRWEEAELVKMKAAGKEAKGDRWREKYEQPVSSNADGLAGLPDGWSWTTVGQLGEVTGGLTKNAARDSGPRRYPYLRVANVYANRLDLGEVKEVAVGDGELPRLLLQRGDLLVVEGNGSVDQIGRVAVWDGSIDPVVHQNHLIKVRFFRTPLERWVLIWLLSPDGRAAIERVASSTSGLHTLSISKVQSLPVPLPPENEQGRVLETVDQLLSIVDASTDALDAGLRRCSRLRQSVLRWAFEGTLVDEHANDESADVLLARIRAERAVGTVAQPKVKRSRKLKAAS
jgi:type I restriction enzyme S subunit